MKQSIDSRSGLQLALLLGVGLLLGGASGQMFEPVVTEARAQPTQETAHPPANEKLPDQAHAMADVGYHFANLWFAADKHNWPLASYYLGETRSHLKWAVRIHSVRKTGSGAEINLNGILDAIDNSYLTQIGTAITNKDLAGFETAYRQTIDGCYACHKACEKPFLRPQIPAPPNTSILNFDPDASWPQ
jgi:hypothetical protein